MDTLFKERSPEGAELLDTIYRYGDTSPDEVRIIQIANITGEEHPTIAKGILAIIDYKYNGFPTKQRYVLNILKDDPSIDIDLLALSSGLSEYDSTMREYLEQGELQKIYIARDHHSKANDDLSYRHHRSSIALAALYRMVFMSTTDQFVNCWRNLYGEVDKKTIDNLMKRYQQEVKYWHRYSKE